LMAIELWSAGGLRNDLAQAMLTKSLRSELLLSR